MMRSSSSDRTGRTRNAAGAMAKSDADGATGGGGGAAAAPEGGGCERGTAEKRSAA